MTFAIIIFIVDAIGHGLVIFRTFLLWEYNPRILWLLIIGSIVVNTVTIASLYTEVKSLSGPAMFFPELGACLVSFTSGDFFRLWMAQASFDIYVVVLVIWNAMARPRMRNRDLYTMLRNDGVFLIFLTWALRLLNAIISAFPDCLVSDQVLIEFSESIITAINSRLLLRTFARGHVVGTQGDIQQLELESASHVDVLPGTKLVFTST
ncbi:uncharacterized protein FOMMEDRAFT_160647 [Fomitiporia mediterranea MF3/22]|uniref:uncharacterized protein n=1 Tax=Fomitiporia mediterranea (strain MF3/22) TaxID=694068 RepID=UPI00044089DE|nr:uncharacterized protein FOMMEDRAFT_160647 [Fomitiporia mediterranea MF3/22]EJC99091.1 hypothetical protein FOMMEDRAFT_160647 [Fomitiporia mediterranea MF3/22]